MTNNLKNITVLICTYNNATRLQITLDALSKCHIDPYITWELVLVNNNSSDNTRDIALSYKGRLPLIYLEEPIQGVSNARNAGLVQGNGELVIFTDDDIKPAGEWIMTYWRGYQEYGGKAFFGGPIESEFEGSVPDNELLTVSPPSVRGFDLGEEQHVVESGMFFVGANWACPRSLIDVVGPVNPSLGLNPHSGKIKVGEETDLMRRLINVGAIAVYLPQAKIKHFVPTHKTTLKHVGARIEAYAEYAWLCNEVEGQGKGIKLLNVPLWMFRLCVELWITCCLKKITGKQFSREYVKYRYFMGCIKSGIHQQLNIS